MGGPWRDDVGRAAEATYSADVYVYVYVFALQTATTHRDYDPLDLDQWQFWVLPAKVLEHVAVDKPRLARVRQLANELTLTELSLAAATAAESR